MNGSVARTGDRSLPKSTPVAVRAVEPRSIAEKAGILSGDLVVSINGHAVRDVLDFQFYASDDEIDVALDRTGEPIQIRIRNPRIVDLGLRFDPMPFHSCGNRCTFCFIDQNPPGMRSTLYLKDEDFRLSFLYGNYVTLTSVQKRDLERIAAQRLSPLFVSIHATDTETRRRLLGIRKDDRLMDKIRFLTGNEIELHGQIVLCPGVNDGEILRKSLVELSEFHPGLRSLSVIPVGLTLHRRKLHPVKPFDPSSAKRVVELVESFQRDFTRRLGEPFVYLADELYLKSGMPIPETGHYGDYWQIANGVGLVRSFLDDFEEAARSFPSAIGKPKKVVIATGESAAPIIESMLPRLRRIQKLTMRVQVVPNRFFGETVTVSGLLTGRDIACVFGKEPSDETVILPSNLINSDGLMLDGRTPESLSDEIGRKVVVMEDFKHFWKRI
jgi:putative radical SAM enzyme (TIGR03279 family)